MSNSNHKSLEGVKHIFGLDEKSKSNFFVMDDGVYVYSVGPRVVIHNPETETQQSYVASDIPGARISAIGCAISKNSSIVCGIWTDERSFVQIFDYPSMKRRKPLFIKPDEEKREISSISVSSNGKYAVSLQNVDWNMIYWSLEKGKAIASTKSSPSHDTAVNHVAICPFDDTKMMAVGINYVNTFKWADGQLKSVQYRNDRKSFHGVVWQSYERALIGCNNSSIAVMESGNMVSEITITSEKSFNVHALTTFSKGIICGGDKGQLAILERVTAGGKDTYKTVRVTQIVDEDSVKECSSLSLSTTEDMIYFQSKDKQTFSISFGSLEAIKDEEQLMTSRAIPSFHDGQVICGDVSAWKPYYATAGKDKSVRIWNYMQNACELVKTFNDEIMSLSLHYTGMYAAVAFKDRVQISSITLNDLKPIHEIMIKNVHLVQFSKGGHYLAAVQGNQIHIYDTWSHELVSTLVGHRTKVTSIVWDSMDYRLISSSNDGAIYEWSIVKMKREMEHITKSSGYKCVISGKSYDSIIAVSNENVLQLIDKDGTLDLLQDVAISDIILSPVDSRLFIGTEAGSIKVMDLSDIKKGVVEDFNLSNERIVSMDFSVDLKSLIVSSGDGSVFLVSLSLPNSSEMQEPILIEEIFISKTDLEQKNSRINELKTKGDEIRLENEYQLHLKDLTYQDKIKELKDNHEAKVNEFNSKNEQLLQEMNSEKERFEAEKQRLEREHREEMENSEELFVERQKIEIQKQFEISEKLNQLEQSWKQQLEEIEETFQRQRKEKQTQFETALEDKNRQLRTMEEDLNKQKREFDEQTREMEEDSEDLILKMRFKYETKLKEEREQGLRIKAENSLMKKKHGALLVEIEQYNTEIQKLVNEEKKLQMLMKTLEKDIQGLKKEIQERDDAIQDKDRRIEDLKKKNQELEKFKFVLDYKMKELKHQIEPREQEIHILIKQIKEMDAELEQYHQLNNALDLKADDLKQRVNAANNEVLKQREQISKVQAQKQKFELDLGECLSNLYEPKLFKPKLLALYHRYCHDEAVSENPEKQIIQLESQKQRRMLEKSLSSLRNKLERGKEKSKVEGAKIIKENMILISEINELRKEIKRKQLNVVLGNKA